MSIRLVPNTGVQYVAIEDIDLGEAKQFSERVEVGAQLHEVREPRPKPQSEDEEPIDDESLPRFTTKSASPETILQGATALNGLWVPIPFDRGGVWAMLYLRPRAGEKRYQAVLAIDTTLQDDGNSQGIDQTELGLRELAPCSRAFWRRPAVASFLKGLARRLEPSVRQQIVDRGNPSDLMLGIVGLAGLLRKRGDTCRVFFQERPERSRAVKVDVVLDLGNSRTAVLLKERGLDSREQRLELVYPSNPTESYPCPFESQSAFARHVIIDGLETGCESFRFMSQIYLGPPARAALRATELDPRPLGISSAKRYLWEERECVPWEWRFINSIDEMGLPSRIDGAVLRRMNTTNPLRPPPTPDVPIAPNYPRLAGTVWAVIEILEQSFRQVNSVAWRKPEAMAPLCERRREIANVILIYPAGMHSKEIENFQKASAYACKLWSEFRTNPEIFWEGAEVPADPQFGLPQPVVQIVSDEGLAVQTCWLYGEVMHRHDGRVGQLIDHLGRKRGADGVLRQTLRLASLDIGGGTIDLAIADYELDRTKGTNSAMTCRRLFHDGISRAGDEIVRSLLEEVVFRQIIIQTGASPEAWNQIFATSSVDKPELLVLRRKLVREVWVPAAMYCLSELEQPGDLSFKLERCPDVRAESLDALQSALFGGNKPEKKLRDVTIEVDRTMMRSVVQKSIGTTIRNCADIVDQYGCDLLVVGGRPSSNPAVREHIYASMAVPPGQVVFLSEMRVGDWYPFARAGGKIGDAKTCGVVGSLLSFEALYGHRTFGLSLLKPEVPRAIIGYLRNPDPTRIPAFSGEENLGLDTRKRWHVTPMVGLRLATRRIQADSAEAKPIYEFRLKRRYAEYLRQNPGAQEQIEVTFELKKSDVVPEQPSIGARLQYALSYVEDVVQEVDVRGSVPYGPTGTVGAADAMELVLKTMLDGDGYWLDTGRFAPYTPQEGGY